MNGAEPRGPKSTTVRLFQVNPRWYEHHWLSDPASRRRNAFAYFRRILSACPKWWGHCREALAAVGQRRHHGGQPLRAAEGEPAQHPAGLGVHPAGLHAAGLGAVRCLLERLYLNIQQEGSIYMLCRGDLVLYSSTDPHYQHGSPL